MSIGWTDAPAPTHPRPHLVLLGAGASYAAFPDGDKHGRKLPLMNDLVRTLGLEPLLSKAGIAYQGENFEDIYSFLATRVEHVRVLCELERTVFDYFAGLELPDQPTLYDHLVLSLRGKDVIATFNWDPFLWRSINRVAAHIAPRRPPRALFLHGNVAIGYCSNHEPVAMGSYCTKCRQCGAERRPSRLLYPVGQKDYTQDPLISGTWADLKGVLSSAYLFTIFGYGAPKTDIEAVNLMKSGWGDANQRAIEQTEIIDVRSEDDLVCTWSAFICRDHYDVHREFYSSMVARYPRRSVEATWESIIEINPQPEQSIPKEADWPELLDWYAPLLQQE